MQSSELFSYNKVDYVPVAANASRASNVVTVEEEEEEDDQVEVKGCCSTCRGCCSVGCVWGIVAGLYFFIIIPTGVLLIIHGYTKSFAVTLALGILLLFIVTCAIPGVFLALRYRQMTRKVNLSVIHARHAKLSETNSDIHHSLTKHIVASTDDCTPTDSSSKA